MQIGKSVKEQAWVLLKNSVNGTLDPYVGKSLWWFVNVPMYRTINAIMLWT